jgi:Zn-finger nucleic acid-binding protein
MRSPLHSDKEMVELELEPGLRVFECPASKGIWIPLDAYLTWQQNGGKANPLPHDQPVASIDDSGRRALLCPESGRLLLRYRVSHDLPFQIDRSPFTGGAWLDKGEWDVLKSRSLHNQMHLIFTSQYQAKLRAAEFAKVLEDTFRKRIGAADFHKVQDICQWIGSHPQRRDILCYLNDSLGRGAEPENGAPGNGEGQGENRVSESGRVVSPRGETSPAQ